MKALEEFKLYICGGCRKNFLTLFTKSCFSSHAPTTEKLTALTSVKT